MLERFQGEEGHRRLIQALGTQKCVGGDQSVADELAKAAALEEFQKDEFIIHQGGHDSDMFFLLAGSVNIVVNRVPVAKREAGEHVGEMALIDPKAERSASVVALGTVVVARVSEPDFARIADRSPMLWRRLAMELADRLRERAKWVPRRNDKPHVFIGSSAESVGVAKKVEVGFEHDPWRVTVWTDGVFKGSQFPIQNLLQQVQRSDYAILVFGPDDRVVSRHSQHEAPRDNVVLELGLFMGALGHERTFIVKPHGKPLKIPTDLVGLTPLEYRFTDLEEKAPVVGPVCAAIREIIEQQGVR